MIWSEMSRGLAGGGHDGSGQKQWWCVRWAAIDVYIHTPRPFHSAQKYEASLYFLRLMKIANLKRGGEKRLTFVLTFSVAR